MKPLEVIAEDNRLHTDVDLDNKVQLSGVTDLLHNAFSTSPSSNKTASAFHLFESLYILTLKAPNKNCSR